ncbi:MAG TPA: TetR/AcrR family transcriptional regulator, partial [Stackebrandtia sp.]|nr:TetR/AcrR family transcriptional regulator [Stackebrandtia sp.]
AEIGSLPRKAGRGTMDDNLRAALLAIPPAPARALARLLAARPDLAPRVREVLGDGNSGIDAVDTALAAYLTAEHARGRLAPGTDVEALAGALAGAFHRLVLGDAADITDRLGRTVSALIPPVARV